MSDLLVDRRNAPEKHCTFETAFTTFAAKSPSSVAESESETAPRSVKRHGIPAPITDDVTVDHVITRSDEFSKLPVGTKAVLEVSPWVLYKLPKPMKSGDLTKVTIPRRLNAEPGSDR